jgi:NADH:ubiquinone oxidoreductase subunit 6 (subunit J)
VKTNRPSLWLVAVSALCITASALLSNTWFVAAAGVALLVGAVYLLIADRKKE